MTIFINGVGNISPQETLLGKLPAEPVRHNSEYLKCIEPNYKEFLNPVLARRMGRVIKMGVAAAKTCLTDAGIIQPGAIITGTGFGCVEDTENFIMSLIDNEEKFLPPVSFIQSTHNTIAAQIALELKCREYNYNYVHRASSFESALLDAMMLINENCGNNVLIGGIDEITPNFFKITSRLGLWKDNNDHLALASSKTNGSYAGEGSSFFVLSNQYIKSSYAVINSVSVFFRPYDQNEIENKIKSFLLACNIAIPEIDNVLYGFSGDLETDYIYHQLSKNLFSGANSLYYKHLCGEYFTSTAFAAWLSACLLKEQNIPQYIQYQTCKKTTLEKVLIYNQFRNFEHSLILLSKC